VAVIGAAASDSSSDSGDIVGSAIGGLFAGTIWGAVIGWRVPRRTLVYEPGVEPPATSVGLVPFVTPTRAGLAVTLTF
jgi:hypothetical protein